MAMSDLSEDDHSREDGDYSVSLEDGLPSIRPKTNKTYPPNTKESLFHMLEEEERTNCRVTPDMTSQASGYNKEFTFNNINAPDYFSSSFPSLLGHLGPNAVSATKRKSKKKKGKQREEESFYKKPKKREQSFTEIMKRKNQAQWSRIEAVAQEKMDKYDRYAAEMERKIHRQREEINRRTQKLMDTLARQEEKKRENKMFESPFGRMWRHHRSMQRRAFSLEPMQQGSMLNLTQPSQRHLEPSVM